MGFTVNKCEVLGNVGRVEQLKEFDSGSCKLAFSVATSEGFKDKSGQWKDSTTWHNVDVWGNLAKALASRLSKGCSVYVSGRMQNNSYEKEGEKRSFFSINAQQVIICKDSQCGQEQQYSDYQSQQYNNDSLPPIEDEELPF